MCYNLWEKRINSHKIGLGCSTPLIKKQTTKLISIFFIDKCINQSIWYSNFDPQYLINIFTLNFQYFILRNLKVYFLMLNRGRSQNLTFFQAGGR